MVPLQLTLSPRVTYLLLGGHTGCSLRCEEHKSEINELDQVLCHSRYNRDNSQWAGQGFAVTVWGRSPHVLCEDIGSVRCCNACIISSSLFCMIRGDLVLKLRSSS